MSATPTTQSIASLETQSKTWRPLSEQPGFIPLPSDPSVKLTREQLNALFAGDQLGVCREILAIGKRRALAEAEARNAG